MFVEEKTQGEVAPAKVGTMKLSEAIRAGLPFIDREDRGSWMFCALSAAFAGVHKRAMTENECVAFVVRNGPVEHSIADAIGFPRDLCARVHKRHYAGERAASIADWLEAQGY